MIQECVQKRLCSYLVLVVFVIEGEGDDGWCAEDDEAEDVIDDPVIGIGKRRK